MSGLSPVWRVSWLHFNVQQSVSMSRQFAMDKVFCSWQASPRRQSDITQSLGTGKRTRQIQKTTLRHFWTMTCDPLPHPTLPQQLLKQQDKATSLLVCVKFRTVQGGDSTAALRGPHSLSPLRSLWAPLLLLASVSSKTT